MQCVCALCFMLYIIQNTRSMLYGVQEIYVYVYTPYFVFYRMTPDTPSRTISSHGGHLPIKCVWCVYIVPPVEMSGVFFVVVRVWEYGKYFDNIPCLLCLSRQNGESGRTKKLDTCQKLNIVYYVVRAMFHACCVHVIIFVSRNIKQKTI